MKGYKLWDVSLYGPQTGKMTSERRPPATDQDPGGADSATWELITQTQGQANADGSRSHIVSLGQRTFSKENWPLVRQTKYKIELYYCIWGRVDTIEFTIEFEIDVNGILTIRKP